MGSFGSSHGFQTSTAGGMAFTQRSGGGFYGRGGGMSAGPRRDLSIIGKTVRIKRGAMKGYLGVAKDATEATVRVELHAQPKTINVDRQHLDVVGAPDASGRASATVLEGATSDAMIASSVVRTPSYGAGAATPMYGAGAATPMHDAFGGGRTPHYGAMTCVSVFFRRHTSSRELSVLDSPTAAARLRTVARAAPGIRRMLPHRRRTRIVIATSLTMRTIIRT